MTIDKGGEASLGGAPDDAAADPPGETLINGKPVWSLEQVVGILKRFGATWQGDSPVIVYQFYDSAPAGLPDSVQFVPLTPEQRVLARQAFRQIAEVADVRFIEETDNGLYGAASGRVSMYLNAAAPSFSWGSTELFNRSFLDPFGGPVAAAIEISPTAINARRLFVGGYNFQSLIHEIEHALGLQHPGAYNANGQPISYENNAFYYQDTRQYTVLSYFDPALTGGNFVPPGETLGYSGATPLLHDIAALHDMYGANPKTRVGDTTYGFNSSAGNIAFDFAVTTAPVVCIYDAGGNDTIDLSGSPHAARLTLEQGVFSDVQGLIGNLSIAYGVTIENAKGTAFGDSIAGNAAANRLQGLAGDDTLAGAGGDDILDGGDGVDTAVFASAASDYDWWYAGDGNWTVTDGRTAPSEGTDTLVRIERLRFSDGSTTLAPPDVPELIAAAFTRLMARAPTDADAAFLNGLTTARIVSDVSMGDIYLRIIQRAAATTAVATLSYEFFTGFTPSKAGLNYLVNPDGPNPASLGSAYYQAFSLENRYINFAVNLGKQGEGAAGFATAYAGLSLFEAARKAYAEIFGAAATDAKIHAILDAPTGLPGLATRADYFAHYGRDGADGLGTKAAAIGFLLAEAAKAHIGPYALANDAYLFDLADGGHQHVQLLATYGQTSYAYAEI